MTPEQQADYDYAMSQIKPRMKINFASMPMVNITFDGEKFQEAMKQAYQHAKQYTSKLDALMYAAMGIHPHIFTAPNCRCTVIPQGSTTDA